MPQIFAAVVTIFQTVASLTGIAAFAVRVVLAVGLSLIQSAFTPHPKAQWRGDTQQISFDPNDPRRILFSRTGTAGALITFQTWGNNNEYIIILIRVADHKCSGLVGAWFNGVRVTIAASTVNTGVGGAVAEYNADGNDNLWITFYNGDWNQPAEAELIANAGGRWTSADHGRGVAYVKIKARYNEKAFPQGLSTLFQGVFEIDGALLYDRRLDTSVGGSGSQRWNDQTTWSLNDNAAVVGENLLRGIRVEDTTGVIGSRTMDVFYGLGYGDADLPFADNIAGMNSCDEAVGLAAGGTEKRYRVGGLVTTDNPVASPLNDVLAAMAGSLKTSPGRWVFMPGVVQTSVRSFTDSDRRLDGPYKYVNDIPLDTIVNACYGKFADPLAMYQATDLPPRLSPSDEAEDGGTRKADTLNLTLVTSQTQGQRVMEIHRRRGRCETSFQLAWAPENLDLEAADWITLVSSRYGWTKTFVVVQGAPSFANDDFLSIVFDIGETASSVFSWTPGSDELSRTNPHFLPSADPTAVAIGHFTVTAGSITRTSGETSPILTITCDALVDPTIVGLAIQYRVVGLPAGAPQTQEQDFQINPATQVGTQSFPITAGLIGGYTYEARAAVIRQPAQDLNWTSWSSGGAAPGTVTQTVVGQGALATKNTVATADINTNAVTNPLGAFTGASQNCTHAGVTVQSVSITTAGGGVIIQGVQTPIAWNSVNITGWKTQIYRDGTLIYSDLGAGYFSGDAFTGLTGYNHIQATPHTIMAYDAPAAGSHTYTMVVASDGTDGSNPSSPGNLYIENAFLFAMEVKR